MFLETLNTALLFGWFADWSWSVLAALLVCLAFASWLVWRICRGRGHAMARKIMEQLNDGAAVIRRDGSIRYSNAAFSELLGDRSFEKGTQPRNESVEAQDAVRSFLASCEVPLEASDEHVLENGRVLNVSVSRFGKNTRLMILRDVSAERAAERSSNVRLQALRDELQQSHRELENFTHVASHDLKEPLRGLTINANFLMREGDLSEVGKERVARMVALCHRMEQLISDLLFFSRLSRSSTALEDVDPTQVITALRVSLTEVLDERGGSISIATELPLVHAESAKIKTVFQNLIVNGVKYNDAVRKVVTVGFKSTVEIGDQVYRDMFYVSDNGIGISENNREKIFGIFSRLNSEKAYGAGTGAGLAFVKKIIEDYGGEITCQSRPGNGSTFYFSLPIARRAETPALRPVQRAAG